MLDFLFGVVFNSTTWHILKVVSDYGAPMVCVIGMAWFVYDRITGGL